MIDVPDGHLFLGERSDIRVTDLALVWMPVAGNQPPAALVGAT